MFAFLIYSNIEFKPLLIIYLREDSGAPDVDLPVIISKKSLGGAIIYDEDGTIGPCPASFIA